MIRVRSLKPSALVVLHLLRGYPEGMCRRTFANHDIYEVSARVGELEDAGYVIGKQRCTAHHHKRRFVAYRLDGHVEDV